MRIDTLLSTIVLVSFLVTIVMAIGSYAAYKLRERRRPHVASRASDMYFSAMCEGVPRILTSGPVLSKLRASGLCPLRLRPRPRRFCCPCLIGSVLSRDEKFHACGLLLAFASSQGL